MAATYRRLLSVDFTKCGTSTKQNFPVLVNISDATLKTVANGGHVQNSSGFDITFWQNPDQSSPLFWEMDFYDGTNGVVWAWVLIPNLSSTQNTNFYMFYGDSTISSFQSTATTVWAAYGGVWHMSADGSTVRLTDSTINNTTATNHGSTAGAGKIAGAGAFASASSQYVQLAAANSLTASPATFSCWVNTSTAVGTQILVGFPHIYTLYLNGPSSNMQGQDSNSTLFGGSIKSGTVTDGAWHYIVAQYDNSSLIGYLDGAKGNTLGAPHPGAAGGSAISSWFSNNFGGGNFLNGSLDEIRFYPGVLTADWILTEYNNQNSPGTFMAVGAEATTTPSAATVLEWDDSGFTKIGVGPKVSGIQYFIGGF